MIEGWLEPSSLLSVVTALQGKSWPLPEGGPASQHPCSLVNGGPTRVRLDLSPTCSPGEKPCSPDSAHQEVLGPRAC